MQHFITEIELLKSQSINRDLNLNIRDSYITKFWTNLFIVTIINNEL